MNTHLCYSAHEMVLLYTSITFIPQLKEHFTQTWRLGRYTHPQKVGCWVGESNFKNISGACFELNWDLEVFRSQTDLRRHYEKTILCHHSVHLFGRILQLFCHEVPKVFCYKEIPLDFPFTWRWVDSEWILILGRNVRLSQNVNKNEKKKDFAWLQSF